MSKSILLGILLTTALLLIVSGCKDDDVTGPGAIQPTLANIWPHADGTSWSFASSYAEYPAPPKANPAETSLPSMAVLHADLQQPVGGVPTTTLSGTLTMTLDGETTTDSGVMAQNLSTVFVADTPAKLAQSGVPGAGTQESMLRLIARSRPDLRAEILRQLTATTEEHSLFAPILLNGGAFAFEDSGYYGYGDLDTAHSWIYLASGLAVGDEFSLQLVPRLVNDIWMYGQIWAVGNRVIGGKTFANVVECMYLIDLGVQMGADGNGNQTGLIRDHIYGTIYYAPTIGPLYLHQRTSLVQDDALQNSAPYLADHYLRYTGNPEPK